MGLRAITQKVFEEIIEAYRSNPDNPNGVAIKVKIDRRTAIKSWETGWPNLGMDPIREIFEKERLAARAELQAKQAATRYQMEKERDDAVKHASNARAQEAQMLNLSRASALQSLAVATQLIQSSRQLSVVVKTGVEQIAKKLQDDPESITAGTIDQCLRWLTAISRISSENNRLAHEAMVMERLHLGEPTSIIGVQQQMMDMSTEDLVVRLQTAKDSLAAALAAGGTLKTGPASLKSPVIGKQVN